jgi:hypothetical protein
MIFKQFKIWNMSTCLSYEYLAKLMEWIERLFFETIMNLIKYVSELKVIDT